jgi:hypothetical protein
VYWANNSNGTIQRANLDGSGVETLVQGLGAPHAVSLDLVDGKLYWSDFSPGDIGRANLDGSGQEILVRNLNNPSPVTVDVADGLMYWGDLGPGFSNGDIRRANLDGSGQQILLTGLPGPGISLDLGTPGTAVFYTVAAPASVPPETSFDITITARDPYGNIATNYQGTVTFSTSDPDSGVMLPADYTFTTGDGGDNGVHTFPGGVTLVTVGAQMITATGTASGITGDVTITVQPSP